MCCARFPITDPLPSVSVMSNERRIKTLKVRQRSLITSLNLIKAFVDQFDEATHSNEVPVRLEHLNQLWSDYNRNQNELETLDDEALDDHLKERTDLETSYYYVKGFLLSHNNSRIILSPPPPINSTTQPTSHVRLPDVKLPVFDGKIANWLNFHDLFVSLVHSSDALSNIQKFYYLRSSLSDEALQLVQSIPISAINYPVAWNLLLQHFQNTARLKQTYVDVLFEFDSLKRESAAELHSLVEKFEANVKILTQLGERTDHWDILLIRMLSSRLDSTTRRDWEEYSASKTNVKFSDLTSFLQRRVTVLQSVQPKYIEASVVNPPKKAAQRSTSCHGASQMNPRKCLICSDYHPLHLCESFSNLSLDEKEKEVQRNQLCRNCLRKGHRSNDCASSFNCRNCHERHHTQLCPTALNVLTVTSASAATIDSAISAAATTQQKTILLATAAIVIVDDNGVEHVGRALLDSGSECCFITDRFSKQLQVHRKPINVPITGIGQASTKAREKFLTRIRSRVGNYSSNVEFLVLPEVTIDLPATSVDTTNWDLPPGIELADPSFASTNSVDIIIGAEIFFDLFRVPGRIPLGKNLPLLINSVFGWIVSGKASTNSSTPIVSNVAAIVNHQRANPFINNQPPIHRTSSDDSPPRLHLQIIDTNLNANKVIQQPGTSVWSNINLLPVQTTACSTSNTSMYTYAYTYRRDSCKLRASMNYNLWLQRSGTGASFLPPNKRCLLASSGFRKMPIIHQIGAAKCSVSSKTPLAVIQENHLQELPSSFYNTKRPENKQRNPSTKQLIESGRNTPTQSLATEDRSKTVVQKGTHRRTIDLLSNNHHHWTKPNCKRYRRRCPSRLPWSSRIPSENLK